MKDSLLMVGQFSPPITGEYQMNTACLDFFRSLPIRVDTVDTCIISSASQVGKFSFRKLSRAAWQYLDFCRKIFQSKVVYLTPGQSFLGMLRFTPYILISLLIRRRIVCHWHGYGVLGLAKRSWLFRKVFLSRRIVSIVLTNDLREQLVAICDVAPEIYVIKNFCSFPTSGSKFPNQRLQVLFLSSLVSEKGIEDFFTAAKDPRLALTDFHVCGTGTSEMLKMVEEYCSSSNFFYHGVASGDSKHQRFLDSDIFVLPTYYPTEGVPLTILEALCCGCAVISTRHNGIPETLGSAGLFVKPKCPGEIADAIAALNDDRALLCSQMDLSLKQSHLFSRDHFFQDLSAVLKLERFESQ